MDALSTVAELWTGSPWRLWGREADHSPERWGFVPPASVLTSPAFSPLPTASLWAWQYAGYGPGNESSEHGENCSYFCWCHLLPLLDFLKNICWGTTDVPACMLFMMRVSEEGWGVDGAEAGLRWEDGGLFGGWERDKPICGSSHPSIPLYEAAWRWIHQTNADSREPIKTTHSKWQGKKNVNFNGRLKFLKKNHI